jgi:LmbE family N-acetylglucosaminyl deacetylase
MARVLMLSPHCDDIPLSLGASLLAGEWGDDVHAIVIFSTSRYSLNDGWSNEVAAQTEVRNNEERRAAAAAGYTVEFLGLPEPGVRPGYTQVTDIFNPALRFEPDPVWAVVHERLTDILAKHSGVAVSPLGVGHHIDHRMVAACFREASEAGAPFVPAFYEDLPYAGRFSSREIRSLVPPQLAGAPLVPRLLSRGRLADKVRLLGAYESQLSEDDYGSVADHWECRGRAELVWWPEGGCRAA